MNALEEFRRGEVQAYADIVREIEVAPSNKEEALAYWRKMATNSQMLANRQRDDAGPHHHGTKMMFARAKAFRAIADLFV